MGDPALAPHDRFTYRHYRTWPDSERWELIEGHAWAMSPAPKRRHQELSGRLFTWIHNFLEGHSCKVYEAPFDVLMPAGEEPDEEVDTIVQPDIVVFCDRSKLTEAGARGAPDLVIEILSPWTSKKDLNEKFRLYEKRGVREYWVIDPAAWSMWVYRQAAPPAPKTPAETVKSGRFDEGELRDRLGDVSPIASMVLEGFVVDCGRLFADLD